MTALTPNLGEMNAFPANRHSAKAILLKRVQGHIFLIPNLWNIAVFRPTSCYGSESSYLSRSVPFPVREWPI